MPSPAPPATRLTASPYTLRPLEAADLALYVALFTDGAVMRAVGPAFAADRAARAAASALRHQDDASGRFRHWVIEGTEGGAGLLGLALRGEAWAGGDAELGVLLWPAWQARGAATAAIIAVRAWAFEVARLASLTCHHAHDHAPAAALMRRTGFIPRTARADATWACGWEHRNPGRVAVQRDGDGALPYAPPPAALPPPSCPCPPTPRPPRPAATSPASVSG